MSSSSTNTTNVVADPSTLTAVVTAQTVNYKATIAVASVYAFICLAILLIALLSRTGRTYLTDFYFPFILTLILSLVAVISVIVWLVMSAKTQPALVTINSASCPDYYLSKQWTSADINMLASSNIPYASYACVPDTSIYTSNLTMTPPNPTTAYSSNLQNMLTSFNAGLTPSSNIYMSCSNIFPAYTAYWDTSNFPVANSGLNSARCELARECGITWTDVCPHYSH